MSPNEASAPSTGPTIRSNVATFFDTSNTIVGVSSNGVWMVSAGQPSSPPPTITPQLSPSGNGFSIEFDAGRDDTSQVADSYNSLCGGADHEWSTNSPIDSSPSELNFYFGLNLQLQSKGGSGQATVYLGQGSSGFANNWWIGGDCVKGASLKVLCGSQFVTLSISGNSDNGFIFNVFDEASPTE